MKFSNNNKTNKAKIMFVIDSIRGIRGGTETQLNLLINNLDKNKYSLDLLCLRETKWIIENSSTLNCRVKTFNINKIINPRTIISFLRIIKYINNIQPDIVMTFFEESNILGVFAARLAKVKVIISTRRDYGLWLKKMNVLLMRLSNRFVKGIVTNSCNVKELIASEEKFDKSKIHVIYNGIFFDNFNLPPKKRQVMKKKLGILPHNKVIGIVANLNPMKKHSTFIKAAKQVLKTRSDIDFIIVGDGPLRTDLEAFARKLCIEDHVHFLGSQENVLPFLSIFDIGVNCSANEGLSNAIMEYMAYGVPCIVAKAGGNEELVKDGVCGYTFELGNYAQLSKLIIKLLEDEDKKGDFVRSAKELIAENFSLERMIYNYNEFFKSIRS